MRGGNEYKTSIKDFFFVAFIFVWVGFSSLKLNFLEFETSGALFQIHPDKMKGALSPDMLATDIAYYLVRKGVSKYNFVFLFLFM